MDETQIHMARVSGWKYAEKKVRLSELTLTIVVVLNFCCSHMRETPSGLVRS